MSTLEVLSVLFATAAIFGLISARWLKLPITVGTMLLTVLVSAVLIGCGPGDPAIQSGLRPDATDRLRKLILHGMLPLLLFAGAFLLDLDQLAKEKLTVSLLSVAGTVLSFPRCRAHAPAHRWPSLDAMPHLWRAHLPHGSHRRP